jgi:capsular polysaccharide biosynthesis protein
MTSLTSKPKVLQRWWVVLLVTLVSVAVGAWLAARQEPVFRATSSLVVAPNTSLEDPIHILRSLETLERRTVIATLANIPTSSDALEQAAEALEVDVSSLRHYRIRGSVKPQTNIIRIEVTGPSNTQVALLANAIAEATVKSGRSMYRIYAMRPLARAGAAGYPIHPDPKRNIFMALVVGLALGLFAAVVPDLPRLRKNVFQGA